jgi:hypothetical protein
MLYKTIVLELIQQHPHMHDQLRKDRMLLQAVEFYAKGLKASHTAQRELIALSRPGSDPSQIASEAMELAVRDLEQSLALLGPDENTSTFLDEAMTFLLRHTPPA